MKKQQDWEKEFDKMFVVKNDEYVFGMGYLVGAPSLVKEFIKTLLVREKVKLIKEIEKTLNSETRRISAD